MKDNELKIIKNKLYQFNKIRDWEKFHSPKNLSMALAAEAGELLDIFQWVTETDSYLAKSSEAYKNVKEELSDIFIYLLLISEKLDIDLIASTHEKITQNAIKYPANNV